MDGILNINKDVGMTSHDVVARVRKIVRQRRVGHAGTLDPQADGVLPVCVGQATRIAEYLSESGKAYEARIVLGMVTDTYDVEGRVVRSSETSHLSMDAIEAALSHFVGPQLQVPPRYSAIKLQGQPAYQRVRAGEEVVMEPRPVTIYQLRVQAWENPQLTLAVECSKGTYIRSLAYDLGEYLGCGAYLAGLTRTRSGPFTLRESFTLDQMTEAAQQDRLEQYIFPIDIALQQYRALTLDEAILARVLHGGAFHSPELLATNQGELARVYAPNGQLVALAAWDERQRAWQPRKVFVQEEG